MAGAKVLKFANKFLPSMRMCCVTSEIWVLNNSPMVIVALCFCGVLYICSSSYILYRVSFCGALVVNVLVETLRQDKYGEYRSLRQRADYFEITR